MRPCFGENSVFATGGLMWNKNQIWKTYYHKEDIYLGHTHFTHVIYSLFTAIMCNLGPGHNNEVLGHEDRYA